MNVLESARTEDRRAREPATIVVADDQPVILTVISQVLAPEYTIVGTYSTGPDLLREVGALRPDLVILDISMEPMSGFAVARALAAMQVRAKVLFLSIHEDSALVAAAMEEGAKGYVFKSRIDTDLKLAVETILAGNTFFSPRAADV